MIVIVNFVCKKCFRENALVLDVVGRRTYPEVEGCNRLFAYGVLLHTHCFTMKGFSGANPQI